VSTNAALAAVLVVGMFAYASRVGLILILAGRTLSASTQRALGYVAPAVLTALVVTFTAGGEGLSGFAWIEVAAIVVGAAGAKLSAKLPVGLVVGMVALWSVTYLFG